MNKNVIIKVISEIEQNGETDNIEFTSEGKFYEKNEKYYLTYDESALSGMEGSSVTIIIDQNKLTINRYGTNKSKMNFVLNEMTYTDYRTLYGNFEMEILTTKLDVNLEGGNIKLEYDLNVKGLSEGKNKIYLEIK